MILKLCMYIYIYMHVYNHKRIDLYFPTCPCDAKAEHSTCTWKASAAASAREAMRDLPQPLGPDTSRGGNGWKDWASMHARPYICISGSRFDQAYISYVHIYILRDIPRKCSQSGGAPGPLCRGSERTLPSARHRKRPRAAPICREVWIAKPLVLPRQSCSRQEPPPAC